MFESRLGQIVLAVLLCVVLFVPCLTLAQQYEPEAPRWAKDDPVNVRQQVTQLYKQGLFLYQNGHFSEALPLLQRALTIAEGLGPDHPVVATVLNNLALVYEAQDRYADAEPLLRRSLAIREKAFGPDHPDVATSLNLAWVYQVQGRYADAEPVYKRSLVILEKALGPDHPDVAPWLDNLAWVYQALGRYADADPLLKRSLAIREKALGPDHAEVANSLTNLAFAYNVEARYAEAEPLYKRSLAIREKALGPDHPDVATSLANLASVYEAQGRNTASVDEAQGRYAGAERLLKRSLAIREKAFGPDHGFVAESLNNLAELYQAQGRLADAKPLDNRSLTIREKAFRPDYPDVATSLNLAAVYQALGRYADAEPLYKRSLVTLEKAFGPDHPNVALALDNLAWVYQAQGRYVDAERQFKRSLAIREKAFGPDHAEVANSLSNLASLYNAQGRYAEAEPLFKRSLVILQKAFGSDQSPPEAMTQSILGLLPALTYYAQGRAAEAEPLVKRSLVILQKAFGPNPPELTASVLGGLQDADPLFKRSMATGALAFVHAAERQNLIPPKEALDASYTVLQRLVSSAAGEAISKLAVRFAAGTDELAQLVRKDQDLTAEVGRLGKSLDHAISNPPNERNPTMENQKKRIDEVNVELAKLQEVLTQQYPDYIALSKPQPLTIEQTQALLADDEALVAIDLDQLSDLGVTDIEESKYSYVWVITKERAEWKPLSVSAKDISKEIDTLRMGLDPKGSKPFDRDLAYRLYRQLLEPIEGIIAQKKRLSFVVDGALTSLPPHVLITSDPGNKDLGSLDWLIRKYAVTVLPSVESLKVLRGHQFVVAAPKPMIGYGNPVFDRTAQITGRPKLAVRNRSLPSFYRGAIVDMTALSTLTPLPDTADELHKVATLLGAKREDIKLGEEATVTDVKREQLSDYRVVYFATHALVAGDIEKITRAKAEPALVLSIPVKPSEEDNGLLTASEVATLKLNADFVVLSACNTAGDGPGAEALSGLARAFFYAGARSLVVSHWEVDDEATYLLMDGLFAALKADPSLSHAEALRLSMLRMIDHPSNPQFAQPAFWAPFVIVGEPKKQNSPPDRLGNLVREKPVQVHAGQLKVALEAPKEASASLAKPKMTDRVGQSSDQRVAALPPSPPSPPNTPGFLCGGAIGASCNTAPPSQPVKPIIRLTCTAPVTEGGEISSVNRSIVSYDPNRHAWDVQHFFNNGNSINRAQQYDITDMTNSHVMSWDGVYKRNTNLRMSAMLAPDRRPAANGGGEGFYIYSESVFEATQKDKPPMAMYWSSCFAARSR